MAELSDLIERERDAARQSRNRWQAWVEEGGKVIRRQAERIKELELIALDNAAVHDAALERITALEAALREYGIHGPDCVSFVPTVIRECKCGLDAALGPTEGER